MACRLPIPVTARILVVRSLPGLGDLLCSVPALRALRAAYPFAKITWLGLPGTEWFAARFSRLIDSWLPFPGFPGIPEGWQGPEATVAFCQQMQTQSYDLMLQMHGSGNYINPFLTLLGGRLQAGFYLPGQYCPNPQTFLPYPNQVSEVERLLQLMTFLEIPAQGMTLEFPLTDAEYQVGLRLLDAHFLEPGKYVCLHPGASSGDRRWSAEGFAQVAQRLAVLGYRVVLTGTRSERTLTQAVVTVLAEMDFPLPVNLTGRTSLSGLAILMRHAALVICNDTGVSHLAAAVQVPSVVVFSNSDMERWAPRDRDRHRPVDARLAGADTTTQVLAEAEDLLHSPPIFYPLEEVCHVP